MLLSTQTLVSEQRSIFDKRGEAAGCSSDFGTSEWTVVWAQITRPNRNGRTNSAHEWTRPQSIDALGCRLLSEIQPAKEPQSPLLLAPASEEVFPARNREAKEERSADLLLCGACQPQA